MRRLLSWILVLLLVTGPGSVAGAHSISATAVFSLAGDEFTVRVMDVYGAAIEGARATASAAAPGAKGSAASLAEIQPGTYRGKITAPSTGLYDILVEITVFDELFRGSLRVRAGDNLEETLVPMVPIDPPLKHSVWGPVLYGAAALVLIGATVVALRRQKGQAEEEEA